MGKKLGEDYLKEKEKKERRYLIGDGIITDVEGREVVMILWEEAGRL